MPAILIVAGMARSYSNTVCMADSWPPVPAGIILASISC